MMNATFVHVEKIIKSRARDAISRVGNALTDVTLGFEKVADSLGDTEGKDRVLSQLSATSAALRGFATPVADGDVDALATALEQSKISTPGPIMIGREGPMPGEQSTSADSGRAGSQELGVADDDG